MACLGSLPVIELFVIEFVVGCSLGVPFDASVNAVFLLSSRLQTGWSVKTGAISTFSRQEQLNDTEQDVIVKVIKRADMLEQLEQQRVG